MASIGTALAEPGASPRPARPAAKATLCLHCSTGSSRQWASLAAALGDGRRVIAPDLLGYGDNPPWPRGQPVSLDDEVSRLMPLLECQDEPVDVVGHSFGAAVALKLALLRPHRVRSLCVYEPVLFGLLREDAASDAARAQIHAISTRVDRALTRGAIEAAAALFIDFWSGDGAWKSMPQSRRDGVRARIEKVRADFEALFTEQITLAALRRLHVPVLCLSGKRSPAVARRVADLLTSTLPDVRSRRFVQAGHMGPVTDADAVNESIVEFFRFLSRRESERTLHARDSVPLRARAA